MKILTDRQMADIARRFRILKDDLRAVEDEKAEMASELMRLRAVLDQTKGTQQYACDLAVIAVQSLGDMINAMGSADTAEMVDG